MSIISVENLSKLYRIGTKDEAADSLVYAMANAVKSPLRNLKKLRRMRNFSDGGDDILWALKDVSFDVEEGEVVGIIGRNGAGKSTLLKILSRISDPTSGRAVLRGRVSSLLEVGTGFHPELTGRENVYMNGTILGMSKREIDRKFDEIVDFSGVEKFLDTPVKRYSSGMNVRLAFAVAAHLEPEILIIDEVLAVGDAEFQKKCLGKMKDVAGEGRTVLFVSHNMGAVENLCRRVIVLQNGTIQSIGETNKGIQEYMNHVSDGDGTGDLSMRKRSKGLTAIIRRLTALNSELEEVTTIGCGRELVFNIEYEYFEELRHPHFGITFETMTGQRIFWLQNVLQNFGCDQIPKSGVVICRIPNVCLVPGYYGVNVGCGSRGVQLDAIPRAMRIEVVASDVFGSGRVPSQEKGLVVVDAEWKLPLVDEFTSV